MQKQVQLSTSNEHLIRMSYAASSPPRTDATFFQALKFKLEVSTLNSRYSHTKELNVFWNTTKQQKLCQCPKSWLDLIV